MPNPTPEQIFIVGMNGSGTTMLLDCLNNHPDLYGFRGETRVIPYFISKLGKYGDLNIDSNFFNLLNDFRHVPIFVSCNDGIPPPLPDNWKTLERSLGSAINSVFRYFAAQDNKVRWCEKTPMHAMHITSIAKIFPNSKFIHVIRDGRDCAASFHRRWGYSSKRTISRWKKVIPIAQSQGNLIGDRYLEITYENLTENPELWMGTICDFLSAEFNEKVLYLSRNQKHSGSSNQKISVNKERWRSYYSEHSIKILESIAGKQLHSLGYSCKNRSGDRDPHSLESLLWAMKDYVRAIARELKSPDRRTKYNFRAKLTAAIKQLLTNRV